MTCVYCVLGFVLLIAFLMVYRAISLRRLARERGGESFDTFRSQFTAEEATQDVLRAVYAKLQGCCSDVVPDFPVHAEDVIASLYGMVDEDLNEALAEVLAACGRQFPPDEKFRRLLPDRIETVRDFVLFVALCPQFAR